MIIRNATTSLGLAGRMAVTASRCQTAVAVIGFALLTALAAKIQVPMIPVPMTMQTAAVLLAGVMLGPVTGAASQLLYLAMGAAGVPVFAGPVAGPAYLLGPTAGYLIGFVFGAIIAGWVAGPAQHSLIRLLAGAAFGTAAILACGVTWLAGIHGLSLQAAVAAGIVPFLPGAAVKIVIVISTAKLMDAGRFRIG